METTSYVMVARYFPACIHDLLAVQGLSGCLLAFAICKVFIYLLAFPCCWLRPSILDNVDSGINRLYSFWSMHPQSIGYSSHTCTSHCLNPIVVKQGRNASWLQHVVDPSVPM
eukprot:scaffold268086_cov19-Tisochrysis_lutea.AAC.1